MNESTLVPREEMSDLDWLARNAHVWPCGKHQPWCYVVTKIDGERTWASNVLGSSFPYSLVDKDKWLARRAELQNKPRWGKHGWPQIFQNEDGHWFGARAEWDFKAHISGGWKGDGVSLLRDDGEYLRSGTILGDWRDTLEKRPDMYKNKEEIDTSSECVQKAHESAYEFEPFVSIEDNQEQEIKQGNGWFERGELPPVGILCLYVVSDRLSVEVEITAHAKFGLCFVGVGKSGESYVSKTAELHRFRPIRTEREVAIDEMKRHLPYPGSWDTVGCVYAAALYDAGYRKGGK